MEPAPIVIAATIAKTDVALTPIDREELEVVLFEPPKT